MSALANAFTKNREIFTMKTVFAGGIALISMVFLGCTACEQNRKTSAPQRSLPAKPALVDACFEECMQANQMRATAVEVIESDCKRSCATP